MACLKILDRSGHSTVDFNDPKARAEAQATFDRLMAQGYMAFAVSPDGNKQIRKFSDVGEETILAPQLVGG
jgi:hypothetical protein